MFSSFWVLIKGPIKQSTFRREVRTSREEARGLTLMRRQSEGTLWTYLLRPATQISVLGKSLSRDVLIFRTYRTSSNSSFSVSKEEVELKQDFPDDSDHDLEKTPRSFSYLKSNPRKSKWSRAISNLNIGMVEAAIVSTSYKFSNSDMVEAYFEVVMSIFRHANSDHFGEDNTNAYRDEE